MDGTGVTVDLEKDRLIWELLLVDLEINRSIWKNMFDKMLTSGSCRFNLYTFRNFLKLPEAKKTARRAVSN